MWQLPIVYASGEKNFPNYMSAPLPQEITIVIPALNEASSIGLVISQLKDTLALIQTKEILVVDDGSTDDTAAQAELAGAKVIKNPLNSGYGFSLKQGILNAQYECVIITDADGTYPITAIPTLLAEYERGVDMVVGARQGKIYNPNRLKRYARYWFKIISEFVVGRQIPDINSGLRVIRRSKILPILPELSNRFSFTTSSTLIFLLKHYFVSYIKIDYQARTGSSKVRYVQDALLTLQIIMEIIAKYNPIKLFLFLALWPGILAILTGVIGLWSESNWFGIVSGFSFAGAWFTLMIGFLAAQSKR